MIESIGQAPIWFLVVFVSAVVLLATSIVYWLVFILGKRFVIEVSPGMFTPASVTFGLIIGFLASQIWADNSRAFAVVMQEASALKTIVTISEVFPSPKRGELDSAVISYIDRAVNVEWPAMGRADSYHGLKDNSDKQGLKVVLSLQPTNESQIFAKQQLVIAFTSLYQARAERLLLSGTSVNYLKWSIVAAFSVNLMLITAFVHRSNRKSAVLSLLLLSFAISLSFILLMAHDRSFTGYISISPDILLNAKPLR